MTMGKEKGYVLYDEVSELLPTDLNGADLEDLLMGLDVAGIEILEEPKLDAKIEEPAEFLDLDLIQAPVGDKTNDPVRMYLREMGTVPLLTREGEVEIAKRLESGQNRVVKARSRSTIVIRELLAMGEDLKKGVRSNKEVVTFDEEEITDEIVQARLNDFTGKIDELAKAYKKAMQVQEKFGDVSQKKNPRPYRRLRNHLARAVIGVSHAVRKLGFTNGERKR